MAMNHRSFAVYDILFGDGTYCSYSMICVPTSLILTSRSTKGGVYLNLFYSGLTQNGVTDISHSNFTSTKFTGAPDIVKLCCLRTVNFTVLNPVFLSRLLDIYNKGIH